MYNTEWVENIEECDLLISHADDEISEIGVEIVNLQQRQKTLGSITTQVNDEYNANQQQLASLNSTIPTQVEGKAKRENVKEQKRLEYRQAQLGDRRESYSNVARVENQRQIRRCQADLAELTIYRNELLDRKTALTA